MFTSKVTFKVGGLSIEVKKDAVNLPRFSHG